MARGPDKQPRKKRTDGHNPLLGHRGPGRAPGQKDPLPRGTVRALKTAHWRVPKDVPSDLGDVADHAFERIVDVLNEKVYHKSAGHVLNAARMVREEVCGPIAQKIAVSGVDGLGDALDEAAKRVKPK